MRKITRTLNFCNLSILSFLSPNSALIWLSRADRFRSLVVGEPCAGLPAGTEEWAARSGGMSLSVSASDWCIAARTRRAT